MNMNKKLANYLPRQTFLESSFNPKAKSPVGASGLTQFMPGTWAEYERAIGQKKNIWDPAHAVEAQRWYMDTLFNDPELNKLGLNEDAKIVASLARYNWGGAYRFLKKKAAQGVDIRNNIDFWITDPGVPAETRNYIKTIYYGQNPPGHPGFNGVFDKAMKTSPIAKLFKEGYTSNPIIKINSTEASEKFYRTEPISFSNKSDSTSYTSPYSGDRIFADVPDVTENNYIKYIRNMLSSSAPIENRNIAFTPSPLYFSSLGLNTNITPNFIQSNFAYE